MAVSMKEPMRSIAESVASAVKHCIENNILKEFLEDNGSEAPDYAPR